MTPMAISAITLTFNHSRSRHFQKVIIERKVKIERKKKSIGT